MADLIDRQAAIETLNKLARDNFTLADAFSFYLGALHDAADNIKQLPSTDAEPVRHGHWIIKDNPGTGWYRVTCSECGEDVTSVVPVIGFFPKAKVIWDFCPECGARMDGE